MHSSKECMLGQSKIFINLVASLLSDFGVSNQSIYIDNRFLESSLVPVSPPLFGTFFPFPPQDVRDQSGSSSVQHDLVFSAVQAGPWDSIPQRRPGNLNLGNEKEKSAATHFNSGVIRSILVWVQFLLLLLIGLLLLVNFCVCSLPLYYKWVGK